MKFLIVILVCLTVLALLCPSAYTIAWSKAEHQEDMPILYLGIGIAVFTVFAGICNGSALLWLGLISALGLFGYVVFLHNVVS